MTVFAHSQTTNKLVNEAANESARVSGQDRKIPPALGTNQITRFGGFRPLASLEKINQVMDARLQFGQHKRSVRVTPDVAESNSSFSWHRTPRSSCSGNQLGMFD